MPTAGRLLLDTNIVVGLINGDAAVLSRVAATDEVFVPSIVLGELYYGAFRSARASQNAARVDALADGRAILVTDRTTARHYEALKDQLRTKGRPIPENDLWIAAIAIQHDLTLATRDAHFAELDSLTIDDLT